MKTKVSIISASLFIFCFSGFFGLAFQIGAQSVSKTKTEKNRDFDFLVGEWRVSHRRLKPGSSDEWIEFEGTCVNRQLMDGSANIEEHLLDAPGGAYRAVGLRSFDPKTDEWAIRWLDSRYFLYPFDPPVKGRFENGVGTFYSDFVAEGKPMRVRFIWSEITSDSARWEQAISADAGKTWQTNWIMSWRRASVAPKRSAPVAANQTGSRSFDFLDGEWRVKHQYLRSNSDGQKWAKAEGICRHSKFTNGWANLDEYKVDAPTGSYQAVALRSYNPKTDEWAIWWLDGRSPGGNLDPPVKGRFENGVGTFYADTTINAKPTRVRFTWSRITSDAARWEQAYSPDGGKTWETNWTMDFERKKMAKEQTKTNSSKSLASAEKDKKAVAELDTEYQYAVKINDAATMDRILADDFVLVTGRGKVYTKEDLLKSAREGKTVYEKQDELEQTVRVWGDTAVVTALLWLKGATEGKPFEYKLWFSDTYVRTPKGWRYVLGQSSIPLPDSP